MTIARCDLPSNILLLIRDGGDGPEWLATLTADQVGYSLAQSTWGLDREGEPRQLCRLHAAFVGRRVSLTLVTDLTGDLCDFARSHHTNCTRMANRLNERDRGTVWDNRGLQVQQVVGWEGVLRALGLIAAVAACENGTNDPYQSGTFFGPRLWGKPRPYALPREAVSARSTLPDEVTLAFMEPDVRPADLSRGQLIHEAEAAIDIEVARFYSELPEPASPRRVRPFHRRKHRDTPIPKFSEDRRFIGPDDLVAPAAEEADAWLRHYVRCRDEFRERPDVAFPPGTIRFRRLGAACDPCKPHHPGPTPPRSRRVAPCPPPRHQRKGRPPPA